MQSIVIHTFLFIGSFALAVFGVFSFDHTLLVLTTVVSLEAIYLSIFIQMTINFTQATIQEVEHDIDEIQEDIDELQEDVGEIAEDVEEMAEEVEGEEVLHADQEKTLQEVRVGLQKLIGEIEQLQARDAEKPKQI